MVESTEYQPKEPAKTYTAPNSTTSPTHAALEVWDSDLLDWNESVDALAFAASHKCGGDSQIPSAKKSKRQ